MRTLPTSAVEVFLVFLKLGLTSFGGPVAHLGYFRTEFVERRHWLSDARYAELVALCQFLPGPASSQVGFALGLQRAGWLGALAAWAGFTLPSALVLIAFAWGVLQHGDWVDAGWVHGLKLAAVAVVAHAVWGMSRNLCPDGSRRLLALAVAALVLWWPGAGTQVLAIALGAAAWLLLHHRGQAPAAQPPAASPHLDGPGGEDANPSRTRATALLVLFAILLLALPLAAAHLDTPGLAAVSAFYQAGALVFGGGHVVLPLLQAAVVAPGWVEQPVFVAGYGAAQAVPGPLFTFAAYLGAVMQPQVTGLGPLAGGLLMLVAVFLPGLLLVAGALPFWATLRAYPLAQGALAGANAAVVGVLGAALVHPVASGSIRGVLDAVLVAVALWLLMRLRWSPLSVVALLAASSWAFALLAPWLAKT